MSHLLLSDLATEQISQLPAKAGGQIFAALERLRVFPQSSPHLTIEGYDAYRQLVVRSYRVIYRYLAEDDEVRIYCILHTHRQLPSSEFLTHQIF
jgi:plasmid stabilization system protein ParE